MSQHARNHQLRRAGGDNSVLRARCPAPLIGCQHTSGGRMIPRAPYLHTRGRDYSKLTLISRADRRLANVIRIMPLLRRLTCRLTLL